LRQAKAGSWKLEAGSWKLEAGSWKLEAGQYDFAFRFEHQALNKQSIPIS